MKQRIFACAIALGLVSSIALPAAAANTALVLQVDLPSLIDAVADQPERFAVEVRQRFSAATEGEWTTVGAMRTWHYSVRVPTAVSMSFHASALALPPSAVLTVTGARASVTYRARDVSRGGLWARPLIGDTLALSVSVPAADAAAVRLEIDSLQAGYRGLGGLPSHPYFVSRKTSAAATPSCIENYSCDANAANQGPAHATVAVLVSNLYQCTGTLVNDTSSDFAPYVLTARHCENGTLGGGAPQAAGSVTIYWDAVSPCGALLGSIYDGGTPVQGNATTVVEQQDAWLIKLDDPPVVNDAYWAGWDATGAVFTGGYSVHHALGSNKQYVGWFGQAILQHVPAQTLSIKYDSTFWGLVNQLGSVGAGASGSAVFDPNNHLVGSASLASLQDGANSAGVCPVGAPPAPASDTVTAQYTALSSVFASTADPTSTTGGATLQSVLDAAGTGKQIIDGLGPLAVTLTADQASPTTLNQLTLSWDVAGATSCTATGGVAGDGWAGAKPVSGSAKISNYAGGAVSYTLTCSGAGSKGTSTQNISWAYIAPGASLNAGPGPITLGGPIDLTWSSNVGPCTASGGAPGDGWAGSKASSGSQSAKASQLGTLTYSLSCGTSSQTVTVQASVSVVPVSVSMSVDSTRVRIGSTVTVNWVSGGTGDDCAGVGGSATDNWAANISLGSSGEDLITETTAGSYTYGVHCSSGGHSADASVSVVFTDDAPALTLTPVAATQQVYANLPAAQPTPDLIWSSNVAPCFISAAGPLTSTGVTMQGTYPNGTATDAEATAGVYTYQLRCGTYTASTSITWINPNPTVTLTAPSTIWVANLAYALFWTTNTTPCSQTGGAAGDGWAGDYQAGQATQSVTEATPGNYTFVVTCGSGPSVGQATLNVTVPSPAASISASPSSVPLNGLVMLTWNSTVAPCTSVDSGGGVNWGGGDIYPSGSIPVNASDTAGTYTYAITCGSGNQTVHASTKVTVAAPPPTTLSASLMTAVVNTPVMLTWNSPSPVCTAVGGAGSDGWSGTKNASGSQTVTATAVGTIEYEINCNDGTAQTQVAYTAPSTSLQSAPTPAVTLASNLASQVAGQSVTLTWTSTNASGCTASGGNGSDGWAGALALSGSMSLSESSNGNTTYTITCSGAPPAAMAQVKVDFTAPTSSSAPSSGGGGGGAVNEALVLMLSLLVAIRIRTLVIVRSL